MLLAIAIVCGPYSRRHKAHRGGLMTASSPWQPKILGGSARTGTRRRGRSRRTVAVAVVAALALTACGQRPSESSGGDTKKPIVIGASLPLTGDFAQPGNEAKRGYEVWRDMVNA